MKRSPLNILSAISLMILASCGQPATRVASEPELVSKWSLTELKTHKGHRGSAAGILEGQFILNGDGSYSNRLQWTKEATGKEQPVIAATGTWALSNQFLICHV